MENIFNRVSKDKVEKFNTNDKSSEEYKEIISFVENPNGTNEIVTNGETYARTYKSGTNNELYIDGTYFTLNVKGGEISLDPYVMAEFVSQEQNKNITNGSGSSTIYLGTSYNLSVSITPANNIKYKISAHDNLVATTGIKYGSSYVMGGVCQINKNENNLYVAYFNGSEVNYNDRSDIIETIEITSPNNGYLEYKEVIKTGKISTWNKVTVSTNVSTRNWEVFGHEKNRKTNNFIKYTATIPSVSKSQEVTPKAPYYVNNTEIYDNSVGTNVKGIDVIYGNDFPNTVTIDAGIPHFAFPEVWNSTPTFKQLNVKDDSWKYVYDIDVKLTSTGNIVKYKVYKHSTTQAQGEWEIIWK